MKIHFFFYLFELEPRDRGYMGLQVIWGESCICVYITSVIHPYGSETSWNMKHIMEFSIRFFCGPTYDNGQSLIKVASLQRCSEEQGQGPRISTEQRCVKSCLHGPEVIMIYINELVIATSELEARASLIYTLSLLRCSEQEEIVPVEMLCCHKSS
jgi:hypothetical protein